MKDTIKTPVIEHCHIMSHVVYIPISQVIDPSVADADGLRMLHEICMQ